MKIPLKYGCSQYTMNWKDKGTLVDAQQIFNINVLLDMHQI